MLGFTRSLAREAGRIGITVNAVGPGFVDTDLTSGLGEKDRDRIAQRSALRRFAEPHNVANAVEFLISHKARNITGTILTVDGPTAGARLPPVHLWIALNVLLWEAGEATPQWGADLRLSPQERPIHPMSLRPAIG
jgi:Enoyl-(Acyl carrier protein) reductase